MLAVGGWLLAAAAATAVGLLALSLLGSGITAERSQPLSQRQAAAALAHAGDSSSATGRPSPSSTAPTTTSRTPTPSPSTPSPTTRPSTTSRDQVTRVLSSPGGNVIARCTGSTVYLLSWTPRQGFETDDHFQGPTDTAYLKFDSDDLDVHVTVTCHNGIPTAETATEPED